MASLKDQCAIVGIGETEYSRNSGRSTLRMALEAITKALDDAGLTAKDVDGLMRYGMDSSGDETTIATNLGVPNLGFWGIAGQGGTAPSAMVAHASAAIMAGLASCVVCFRSINGYSEERFGTAIGQKQGAVGIGSGWEPMHESFQMPYGLLSPAQVIAMMARRHMHEYGTTYEQFGAVATSIRKHANLNPRAMFHDRLLTMEDYMKGRMIADPFRVYDCATECDGACAIVITSAERARDLRQAPAYIMAATQGAGPIPFSEGISEIQKLEITVSPGKWAAQRLFPMAEVTPQDIDVAQIYDCFTYSVITQLEDYGFCNKGEGGPFVEGGRIELGGQLPVNTSGGNLSEAYIHGMELVLEGVRQVRGISTAQVKGAEICLITSAVPAPTSAMILRR